MSDLATKIDLERALAKSKLDIIRWVIAFMVAEDVVLALGLHLMRHFRTPI